MRTGICGLNTKLRIFEAIFCACCFRRMPMFFIETMSTGRGSCSGVQALMLLAQVVVLYAGVPRPLLAASLNSGQADLSGGQDDLKQPRTLLPWRPRLAHKIFNSVAFACFLEPVRQAVLSSAPG